MLSSVDSRLLSLAERFLQSVVLVDEQMVLQSASADMPHGGLTSPEIGSVDEDLDPPPARNDQQSFHVKELIDQFASRGIACAPLKPDRPDTASDRTQEARRAATVAKRADITILDWEIYGDDGELALTIIKNLLEDDQHSGRLRLIAIYTGHDKSEVSNIYDKLRDLIAKYYPKDITEEVPPYSVRKGPVTVSIFLKSPDPEKTDETARQYGPSSLATALVVEYAKMTDGLLPRMALAGLGALRGATHKLLLQFHRSLDPAYLGHRASLERPEGAEQHLESMLGAEILSVLEDSQVGQEAGGTAINQRLQSLMREGIDIEANFRLKGRKLPDPTIARTVHGYLKAGSASKHIQNLLKRDESRTVLFTASKDDAIVLDHRFVVLSTHRTQYSAPPRVLTQGTIIRDSSPRKNEPKYFICVTPRCDCVIRGGVAPRLVFLPLEQLTKSSDRHSVIIQQPNRTDEYLRFRVNFDTSSLTIIEFDTNHEQLEIQATKNRWGYYFREKNSKRIFRWEAELNTDQAQRISSEFGYWISRVGLDEPEPHRRTSSRLELRK